MFYFLLFVAFVLLLVLIVVLDVVLVVVLDVALIAVLVVVLDVALSVVLLFFVFLDAVVSIVVVVLFLFVFLDAAVSTVVVLIVLCFPPPPRPQAFMHVTGDGEKAAIDTSKFVRLPMVDGTDGRRVPKFK